MRHRDARLFFLSMEVYFSQWNQTRKARVKTVIELDDDARPAVLQVCKIMFSIYYVAKVHLTVNTISNIWSITKSFPFFSSLGLYGVRKWSHIYN